MKRSPQLRDLSDDHHGALVLARRCKRCGDAVDARATWTAARDEFAARLEPHFAIEERLLLPALEAVGERRLAERTRREHAELRSLVSTASASSASVRALGALLESHVRFEEREMFGVAEARLPGAALEAIAEACRAARSRLR